MPSKREAEGVRRAEERAERQAQWRVKQQPPRAYQNLGASSPASPVGSPSAAEATSALRLTLGVSLIVAVVNAVAGTAIAWTLVRDRFVGQGLVNALVDLPFALPTIVAGLTLLALYGPRSPVGVDVSLKRVSDEEFARDAEAVAADLTRLKRLLESAFRE